jgi:hypothetical protein
MRKGPVRSASFACHATSEPARTVKNLPCAGHSSRSESSVNPAALNRCATVTQTWNGDGDASMNSHSPCALAAMVHHHC